MMESVDVPLDLEGTDSSLSRLDEHVECIRGFEQVAWWVQDYSKVHCTDEHTASYDMGQAPESTNNSISLRGSARTVTQKIRQLT